MSAAQQIMGAIFDFQRNIVYPQQAINSARGLIGQVQGIYNTIRGFWNVIVQSATLPNPRQLEAVILSRDPGQVGSVAANFSAVYTPLPAATEAAPCAAGLDRQHGRGRAGGDEALDRHRCDRRSGTGRV